MKTKKNIKKVSSILGSALIAGSMAGFSNQDASAASLFESQALGSGAELRTNLINANSLQNSVSRIMDETSTIKFSELKCGEGKCGEGKCGEEKEDKKEKDNKTEKKATDGEAKTAETKESEDKTKEAKCGEGKCG